MAKLVIGTNKTVVVPAIVKEVSPVEKYGLLTRVKDDSNNEIGTVCGYHTDANNVEYAVVCLDAQYRKSSAQYLSENLEVTGLPLFADQTVWDNTDTATSNCTKILDFATANNRTSSSVSHCRSKSFVIEGITYYGQLPTIAELVKIFMNRSAINSKDTSASQYSSLIVPSSTGCWASSQYGALFGWYVHTNGAASGASKQTIYMAMPILEIPIV